MSIGAWGPTQIYLWYDVCKSVSGTPHVVWFDSSTYGARTDFEACALAAEQGSERAQRYMTKLMELRMKS